MLCYASGTAFLIRWTAWDTIQMAYNIIQEGEAIHHLQKGDNSSYFGRRTEIGLSLIENA